MFPVSSGDQHRKKETAAIEWHEVTPEEKAKAEEEKKNLKKQMALMPWVKTSTAPVPEADRVFDEPEPDVQSMDIGSVVTERLNAMRKLQVSCGGEWCPGQGCGSGWVFSTASRFQDCIPMLVAIPPTSSTPLGH